jgi:hypothetical protein
LWGNCYGHQLLVWDPRTGRSQSFSLCPTDHKFSPGRHAQWKKEIGWGLVSKQVQRIKGIGVCNASIYYTKYGQAWYKCLLVQPVPLVKCELVTKLIFSFQNHFCNLIEFPMTKTTQNSISLTP